MRFTVGAQHDGHYENVVSVSKSKKGRKKENKDEGGMMQVGNRRANTMLCSKRRT